MATALTNEKPKNTYKDLFHLGAGNVGLTASTPQQGYDGLGNLTPFKMATDELQMTQPLTLANGVVGAPSLAWANSLTTGLYRSAADTIGVAVAGALDFSIAANTFNVLSGSDLDINSGATLSINGTLASALTVANGGTGAATLTDGGILLGSGGSAISAMAVLSDGEMIVGDGSGDPVAESGATLRTSIGVGTGDSPQFTGITGGLVFNETGADVDYRFEGDTDANVLWIDGGQDTIGIGRQPSSTSTLYVGAGATQDTQYNVMDFGCYGTDPTLQVGGFSVSTSAVEIHDHLSGGVSGGLCLITGGTDPHTFTDLVLWHSQGATTPIVIASKEKNTPSARTYAHSSGYLTVQIATGTVTMTALGFSMRSN